MVKKVKKKEVVEKAPVSSTLLRDMVNSNRKKYSSTRNMVGDEITDKTIGIPWPSLALMWLTQSTILPLGKIIGVAGDSQSQKSSLGFEMLGWLMRYGGIARLLENEGGKWSDSLIRSLIGPFVESGNFSIDECADISEVHQMTTSTLEFLFKNQHTSQLTGIMVDSLMGTATRERVKKITEDGAAGRSFADGALFWSDYMKYLAGRLIGWPVIFLFINHIKDKPAEGFNPSGKSVKTTPGGKAQRYYSAVYFWVSRTQPTSGGERATWEVNGDLIACPITIRTIKIKCDKNSLGVDGRVINVDFCWWYDKENKQHSFFNWDAATTLLLLQEQDTRGFTRSNADGFAPLRDICKISAVRGAAGDCYSCKRVNMTGKMSHTVGAAIHADKELMNELIDFFHVHRRPAWDGSMLEEPIEDLEEPPPINEGSEDGPDID
jgi:hypothetical protein